MRYAMGDGVPEDFEKARILGEQTALQGHADAQFNLGMLYLMGLGIQKDFAKAREYFEQATHQGHIAAQRNLEMLHENGQDTPQNFERELEYWERAAHQGYATAQLILGLLYAKGQGASQEYLRQAARQENRFAIFALQKIDKIVENRHALVQANADLVKWVEKTRLEPSADVRRIRERMDAIAMQAAEEARRHVAAGRELVDALNKLFNLQLKKDHS